MALNESAPVNQPQNGKNQDDDMQRALAASLNTT
jgi:hypothetical protein